MAAKISPLVTGNNLTIATAGILLLAPLAFQMPTGTPTAGRTGAYAGQPSAGNSVPACRSTTTSNRRFAASGRLPYSAPAYHAASGTSTRSGSSPFRS